MSNRFTLVLIVLAALVTSELAHSQCLDWHTFPRTVSELIATPDALETFDDGSGPRLYCGGQFLLHTTEQNYEACQLVTWGGAAFHKVPTPSTLEIKQLLAFDDGSGPALYAADANGGILEYQAGQWRTLATVAGVRCLAAHDDGSGMALYIGGTFTQVGSVAAGGVAKWNGSSWESLGIGPGNGTEVAQVACMISHDDGSGPALYVAGVFTGLPSSGSHNIARWRGGSWSGVGSGLGLVVLSLATADFGTGRELFASGSWAATGMSVQHWNGTTWARVGSGITNNVWHMRAFDLGGATRLFAASTLDGNWADQLNTWDGTSWTVENEAFYSTGCNNILPDIRDLAAFDEGSGPHLFAATSRGTFGLIDSSLARRNGSSWERVGAGLTGLASSSILALQTFDDGSGPSLYAGGHICFSDEQVAGDVVRWDGSNWVPVGFGLYGANALTAYDPGTGPMLVVSRYVEIARWIGSQWTTFGNVQGGSCSCLQQFGSFLFVGGSFLSANPGVNSPNLARWSPSTGFVPVGTGSQAGANGQVNAMTTFDDGHGAALYAAGSFTLANGVALAHIGRFDGTNWSSVAGGANDLVDALTTFDDGTGLALYAAGTFTTAGGTPASCVAKWNGTAWSALGAGLNAQVLTLGVFDDGSGPALYAGGNFTASGQVPMERLARWNGASWSAVGGNVDGTVWTLKSFDDGSGVGPQLFVGGTFQHAGSLPTANIAAWRGCGGTISKFCFGDGSTGACPCGNFGLSGRGCNNSAATGGARLNATGTTSPDTIVLHAGGELPNAPTLVFQGSVSLSQPILFGDGMRCVGGKLKRLFTTNAVGGAVDFPDATQMSISTRSAALGDPLVPGSMRSYQTWYRDPNLSFCGPPSGDAWNLSNAVRIVW